MAWSDFEAPNRSCDLISAPCSTIPTNWRRIGGIASLAQPSGNVPSNFDWWSSMCRLKTFAALAITSASVYSEAFDSDNATSFWNARRTPLPFLWAWSSGISANNLSFNLVVLKLGKSAPSCARRCWYNWEISERGKTVGSSDCRLVSIIYSPAAKLK